MTALVMHLYECRGCFRGEVGDLEMFSASVLYTGEWKAAYDRKTFFLASPKGQDQRDTYVSLGGTLVAPWPNPQGATLSTLRST